MDSSGAGEAREVREYRMVVGGYAVAAFVLLTALTIAAATFAAVAEPSLEDDRGVYLVLGIVAVLLVAWAIHIAMREKNARVFASEAGVAIQDWRKRQRFVAWETIVGMRWEYRPKRGDPFVELQERSYYACPQRDRIYYWQWGAQPQSIAELAEHIAVRGGLVEVESKHGPWWSRTGYVVWRQP